MGGYKRERIMTSAISGGTKRRRAAFSMRTGKSYRRRSTKFVRGRDRRNVGFYGRFGTGRGRWAQVEKKNYDQSTIGAPITVPDFPIVDLSLNTIPQVCLDPLFLLTLLLVLTFLFLLFLRFRKCCLCIYDVVVC